MSELGPNVARYTRLLAESLERHGEVKYHTTRDNVARTRSRIHNAAGRVGLRVRTSVELDVGDPELVVVWGWVED